MKKRALRIGVLALAVSLALLPGAAGDGAPAVFTGKVIVQVREVFVQEGQLGVSVRVITFPNPGTPMVEESTLLVLPVTLTSETSLNAAVRDFARIAAEGLTGQNVVQSDVLVIQ